MPRNRSHAKQAFIPQKLREEMDRLKEQGLKIKGTEFNLDGPNKLSQAITTLLSPYKDMGSTYPAYYMLVTIACLAWNAALVEEPERGKMVNQVVDLFKDKTNLKGLIEFRQFSYKLIERKLLLFPDDLRYVVKFDVTETKDTFHIFVISLDKSVLSPVQN
jgi:hypothetical protein